MLSEVKNDLDVGQRRRPVEYRTVSYMWFKHIAGRQDPVGLVVSRQLLGRKD